MSDEKIAELEQERDDFEKRFKDEMIKRARLLNDVNRCYTMLLFAFAPDINEALKKAKEMLKNALAKNGVFK